MLVGVSYSRRHVIGAAHALSNHTVVTSLQPPTVDAFHR